MNALFLIYLIGLPVFFLGAILFARYCIAGTCHEATATGLLVLTMTACWPVCVVIGAVLALLSGVGKLAGGSAH